MRTLTGVAIVFVFMLSAQALRAEDDAPSTENVTWKKSLREAYQIAKREQKPLFVAMHEPTGATSRAWPASATGWAALYRHPRVVSELTAYVCVQQIRSPALLRGFRSASETQGAPYLMVLDASQRALALEDRWTAAQGDASVEALVSFLRTARQRYETLQLAKPATDEPTEGREEASRRALPQAGSILKPTPLSMKSPALRIHLRWSLPAPALRTPGAKNPERSTRTNASQRVGVNMMWDDQGPFALEPLTITPGEAIEHALDIRLNRIEALQPFLTKGKHAITIFLREFDGTSSLGNARVPVARVWVALGEGGGGGGAQNEPTPDERNKGEDEADKPIPDKENEKPPQVEPEEERQEVVDPFVRNDETVKKDDAIVAVEDENAGLKQPQPEITEEQLRQFEALRTAALRDGRISKSEAEFLARYFAALKKRATSKPRTGATK